MNTSDVIEQQVSLSSDEEQIGPGYWIFRGEDRTFLFDEICSKYFSFPYDSCWIPEVNVLSRVSFHDVERFYRVMDTQEMGAVIFEDITMTKGDYSGNSFVINGSVLSRYADGRVRNAVGYVTLMQSSFSEFLAHEMAGDIFYVWDYRSHTLNFSSSYQDVLGYNEHVFHTSFEEWITSIIHPDDNDIVDIERHIVSSANYGDSFEFCVRLRHANGNYMWLIGRGVVTSRDKEGRAMSMIGTLSDINLVQDNFENIKQLLYTDTLTGLKNRSFFQHNTSRWQDEHYQPISVIYADVTGLKITNDVLGHADGDILLLTVTDIMTTVIDRPCDFMRLAGDEFLAIITNCTEQESLELLQKLKDQVALHNQNKDVMPVFVGFGRATMGEVPQDTLHACIERADVRMQAYKDATRVENYRELKAYLEKRKGRPVSMRDGRRIDYMSQEEREHMHTHPTAQNNKSPY